MTRRDFLNGTAVAIAAGLTPLHHFMAQAARGGVYPPALVGMRGTTDDAFKVMHGLALERQTYDIGKLASEETYDLVVVGAGLAGLTAAWSLHERRPKATILILDNNDDFGGHARRTEHSAGNRLMVSYGGSELMVAPTAKFTGELARILKALKIEPQRFEQESVFHRRLYPSLGLTKSVFFNKEVFGRDALVTGDPLLLGFDEFAPDNPGARPVEQFLADSPLSLGTRDGLIELFAGGRDYLAGLTTEAKLQRLEKTSYRTFLTEICKLPAQAANFFQGRSTDNWGFGIDALGAIEMMADGYPGAKALRLEGRTAGSPEDKVPYIHHFPDGNASLARAMVRSMVPSAIKGNLRRSSMESLVTAQFDYARLDRPGQPVRLQTLIRLSCVCGIRPADRASRSVT